jgi:hypothetical protein
MKKRTVTILVLVLIAAVVLTVWHARRTHRSPTRGNMPPLRAMMMDEDAPRPIEPSLGLRVNEEQEATVFAGTAVWFSVNVANAAAMNDLGGTRVLAGKITHLTFDVAQGKAPPEELQRATADYQKRTAPSTITLGDASHPWTDAVQFLVRDDQGGEKPLPLALKPLGDQDSTIELDTIRTAQANFGNASAEIAPGTHSIVACLGATGSWHGRACSDPVKLTVSAPSGELTPEQELSLDRQQARFALLAADYGALEMYGRKLVERDSNSILGHMYLGEAKLGEEKWDDALREFVTARAQFFVQHPNNLEPPTYLNYRINQVLENQSHTH